MLSTMDCFRIVLGTEECPIKTIHSIIQKGTVIKENWSQFAAALDIPSGRIKELRQNMQLDKIKYSDLIFDVLEQWNGMRGSHATLDLLLKAVEREFGEYGIGESLRLRFNLPCKAAEENPAIEWKDLSPAFQNRVKENVQSLFPNLEFGQISLSSLKGPVLGSLIIGKMPHLFKQTLPEQLSYYINRTVISRNIISSKIFQDDIPDIFLFIGMDRSELSGLTKNKLTSTSTEQFREAYSTARFIVQDRMSHFQRMCERSNQPVHLLMKQGNGKFKWLRSHGKLVNLQRYVDETQQSMDEDTFCRSLDTHSMSVCISDSPGMGKSVLLAQIGHMLTKRYPNREVIFITLNEFIKAYEQIRISDKLKAIELVVQNIVCQNAVAKAVLQSKMNSEEVISIELLLDGFDEVDLEHHKFAYEIFQIIQTFFKSIRLWITSRPHFLEQLEGAINQLGYNIRAFCEEDQIHFLSSFWSRTSSKLNSDKIREFARYCLKSLKSTINSADDDIAGIPLQCLLIGEVYEMDAREYAQTEAESSFPLETEIGTIANLYHRLIDKKFQKYGYIYGKTKYNKKKLMEMHVSLSLELLFPEYVKKHVKEILTPVVLEEVLKVGLLESGQNPRFVHRTIAEYFVSWFVIEQLSRKRSWRDIWRRTKKINIFADFLLKHVLGCRTKMVTLHDFKLQVNSNEFRNPVISYFVNFLIANLHIQKLPSIYQLQSEETMEEIAHGCVNADFVHIFNFFDRFGAFEMSSATNFNKSFLLLSIRNSGLELIRPTFIHFEQHREFDLDIQTSALRTAVQRGAFSVVEFLIKEKNLQNIVEELNTGTSNLLHDCVKKRMNDPIEDIEQHKQVLRMLVAINPSLLESKDYMGNTPILSGVAHVQFITELIGLGADVMVEDWCGNTVLHLTSYDDDRLHISSSNYQVLLMSIPEEYSRQLVHKVNVYGNTPLMALLGFIDPLPQTLETFKNLNADFNFLNDGKSLLECAIRKGRSVEVIRLLIQLGASVECGNSRIAGTGSLLHFAVTCGNVKIVELLLDEFGMNVNAQDEEGLTPLDYVIKDQIGLFIGLTPLIGLALHERGGVFKEAVNSDDRSWLHIATLSGSLQVVKLLIQLGVNVNGVDKQGNTALHLATLWNPNYVFSWKKDGFSIIELLSHQTNPDVVNNDGDTPFHFALKNDDLDLRTFKLLKSKTNIVWTRALASIAMKLLVRAVDDMSKEDIFTYAQELVNHGADVNCKDADGNSLMHIVANRCDWNVLRFLVENGADVNLTNNREQTPLLVVASHISKEGGFQILKFLIDNDANVYAKDEDDWTFLHIVVKAPLYSPSQFHSMVEYLVEKNMSEIFSTPGDLNDTTPLQLAVQYLEPGGNSLSLLHSSHVNFNTLDLCGNSVLSYAVMGGKSPEFLYGLISQFGADPNILDNSKWSLLHLSAYWGMADALKLFLDLGTLDINGMAKNGDTPLLSGVLSLQNNAVEICRLLIDCGANKNIMNLQGDIPLSTAIKKFQKEDKSMLLRLLQ